MKHATKNPEAGAAQGAGRAVVDVVDSVVSRALVGRLAWVMILVVAGLAFIVATIGDAYVAYAAIAAISVIVLPVSLATIWFAHKHPTTSMLEGAEMIRHEQIQQASKSQPIIVVPAAEQVEASAALEARKVKLIEHRPEETSGSSEVASNRGRASPGGGPVPVDRSYVAENDAERERLRALVRRLSDQDLARPMAGGWTVAGVLAHVAFWDQRIVVLLDEWVRRGPSWTPPHEDERDVHWINDAAKALCLALPPRVAAELAVSVAETVDRRVAGVSDAIIEANARAGPVLNWRRAVHRREHLDEIDEALRPDPA